MASESTRVQPWWKGARRKVMRSADASLACVSSYESRSTDSPSIALTTEPTVTGPPRGALATMVQDVRRARASPAIAPGPTLPSRRARYWTTTPARYRSACRPLSFTRCTPSVAAFSRICSVLSMPRPRHPPRTDVPLSASMISARPQDARSSSMEKASLLSQSRFSSTDVRPRRRAAVMDLRTAFLPDRRWDMLASTTSPLLSESSEEFRSS